MAPRATLMVSRPTLRLVDRLMAYTVWVDGKDVGAIRNGETRRFSVSPGVHQVLAGISGRALGSGRIWTSQNAEVRAKAGHVTQLTCSPNPLTGIVLPRHRLRLCVDDPVAASAPRRAGPGTQE